ncbi:hypothetical protein [Litorimonas haliclonae]|uniref:hypothetical protein n=1 Tax=Litorimonas haliclonae TaxID=2081977 RepID=UPI0039EE1193
MKTHNTWRGVIAYTSKKADRMNENRGRETFTLHEQTNGTSVLHAHTEIDDAPDVLRDVTASFETKTLNPIDGFSRLSVGGQFEGCGWFQFDETYARFSGINSTHGPNEAEIPLTSRTPWFGHHAIINDGFLGRLFPLGSKPGKVRLETAMMSSPDHRGATGPELFPLSFGLVYTGDEKVSVGAGTFEARKFQIVDTAEGLPEEHPPYEMWCSNDEQGFFLQGGVGGYMETWYELVSLEKL